MEGVMWTFAMVLLLVALLFAMGVMGALMTAGVRQIVDEIERQELHRSSEAAPSSNQASLQPSPPPIPSGRT